MTRDGADLFVSVSDGLADLRRRLPDGRTLGEWAPDAHQLALHVRHVRMFSASLRDLVVRNGLRETVSLLACYAAVYCWRWWLTPGWPMQVEEFVRRVTDPSRWADTQMIDYVRRFGRPSDGMTAGKVRALLLAGPDLLDADAAMFCLRAGLGCLLPQDVGMQPIVKGLIPAHYLDLVSRLAVPDEG